MTQWIRKMIYIHQRRVQGQIMSCEGVRYSRMPNAREGILTYFGNHVLECPGGQKNIY